MIPVRLLIVLQVFYLASWSEMKEAKTEGLDVPEFF